MNAKELVDVLKLMDSSMGNAILALDQVQVDELMHHFDPNQDALIHLDSRGFSINYGNVGNRGITYAFMRGGA